MNLTANYVAGLVLSAFFLALFNPSAADEHAAPCAEFGKLMDAPTLKGIERYALEKSIPIGGNVTDERYFNIDIDGDDVSDTITLNCSSSSMPADLCELRVESSSGKKIEFKENRFYLVRFRSKIYAVANHFGPNINVGKRNIYRVNGSGVKLVCSNL